MAQDRWAKLLTIAGIYNATVEIAGDTAFIRYQGLGEGSIISYQLEELYGGIAIKMKPSEKLLEVKIL